ncbi:exodeoxyribonuclease VII small subunit [Jeotgalibacillus campisalis]|uniref:Exodeoxyribonuclease 7 small subunit n=1 Tax=Jeotgalibacillus campisalis TaxID=220754 RepID=A0A0C2VAE7_9BACL|nr:exodeoxyribonuclease VII small subunit [Jeotgalibacillus campisalis]KIL45942.1 exodeoxyribonuclease VII small subunit [Jeotgalibacillus campisalis]
MTAKKQLSFEEAMNELETIVVKLEEGDVPLEEALTIYQKGMELSKLCHDKLQQAEKQMATVMTEEGEKPLDIETEEEGS